MNVQSKKITFLQICPEDFDSFGSNWNQPPIQFSYIQNIHQVKKKKYFFFRRFNFG